MVGADFSLGEFISSNKEEGEGVRFLFFVLLYKEGEVVLEKSFLRMVFLNFVICINDVLFLSFCIECGFELACGSIHSRKKNTKKIAYKK